MPDAAEVVAVAQAENARAVLSGNRDGPRHGIVTHHLASAAIAVADEQGAGFKHD